jgi:uncharacterized protein YndB with AHSA1/START domain
MNAATEATLTVVEERVLPHAPEKVWRALTQSALMAEWLLANDFKPEVGHRFTLRAQPQPGWDGIVEGVVTEVEPPTRLVYSWTVGSDPATGLQTLVVFTLAREGDGTRLRMEQSGFRPDQENNRRGAQFGWRKMLAALERVVAATP